MTRRFLLQLTALLLALTFQTQAAPPEGSAYLDGGDSPYGLILLHGKGKGPRWLVVNPVRKGVHEQLGWHTLSLQMPTGPSNWRDYADLFPEAYQRIKEGIRFLREEKGVRHIYLLGHSMGSRMASAFVHDNPDAGIEGLIVVGCRNNGGRPLACDENLEGVRIPVLDIWGGGNEKDYNAGYDRKRFVSDHYQQVEIEDAGHKFIDYEDDLIDAVVSWLKEQTRN